VDLNPADLGKALYLLQRKEADNTIGVGPKAAVTSASS
jgi:hypothetical protein